MSLFSVRAAVPEMIEKELSINNKHLSQLLFNRGVTTKAEADQFLYPSYEEGLHDPFLLHDMDKAVKAILKTIESKKKIVIFSDYDCDGIPGAVVLHDFFMAIGFENFANYIPHRHFDGFGLSEKAVLEIKSKHDPSLIITIDCGTTDLEAVEVANDNGMEVIVTDHHEPKAVLPDAVAVVNPKVGDTYPFTGLCGAGVIFKLVQALIARGNFTIPPGLEKWWLDMVGVATIADMVPLKDENRIFATYGLKVLRKTRRPGLQKLLRQQRVDMRYLSEDDIGFTIGPRINAASRMDNPEDAFQLLATKDENEAELRVLHLEKLNTDRKTAVAVMTKEAHKRLGMLQELPEVLVFGNPEWRPSLVGLVANKLAEEHNRPAFLWGKDGNGMFKGSCRSGGSVSVVKLMEVVPEIFHEFGGHHMSGGFSVKEEQIHFLSDRLRDAYKEIGQAAVINSELQVDMELTLDMVDLLLLQAQKQCAPFGCENEKPLYLISDFIPEAVGIFGKTKEHTKITFATTGIAKEAIAFFKTPDDFTKKPEVGIRSTLLCHLEESYFMNRLQIRLRIVDII